MTAREFTQYSGKTRNEVIARISLPSSREADVIGRIVDGMKNREFKQYIYQTRSEVIALISLLSNRETDVMRRVVDGMTNKDVATEIGISVKTVEMHRGNLMKKLRINCVAHLVRLAVTAEPGKYLFPIQSDMPVPLAE